MNRIIKIIETLNRLAGEWCSYLIYAGMIVLVYEVFIRYTLHTSELWTHGMAQRLFTVYYIMAGGYVLLQKGHINMDLIYEKAGPKAKALLDLFTSICIAATGIILIWKGGEFAYNSLIMLEGDNSAWNAPIYPVKLFMPLAGILLTLQALAELYKNCFFLTTGKEYNGS